MSKIPAKSKNMRLLWEIIERCDRATFVACEKLETLRKKPSYRKRIEQAVDEVRAPQRVIEFDA